MKKALVVVLLVVAIPLVLYFFRAQKFLSPLSSKKPIEKPLEKYTFENLRKKQFLSSAITLGRILEDENTFISQIFYYTSEGKKVSGLINVPKKSGIYPVVVMFRGFVPIEKYSTGIGTKRAGEFFASNNFITLAPDFFGYGESSMPSSDSIEERFQTYTTALTLLSSLQNLNSGLSASYSGQIQADTSQIGIWGHSNGGQISLSILSITGKTYPTVLWAPVSKPFPYSVLYFTDEFDDHGKALRKAVGNFEKDYDIELYSPTNYYKWIQASIQLHQGDADDAVPIRWSDVLYATLKKQNLDITYFTYPGADHNMSVGWSTAITRSIQFYKKYFK